MFNAVRAVNTSSSNNNNNIKENDDDSITDCFNDLTSSSGNDQILKWVILMCISWYSNKSDAYNVTVIIY